ncbi:MAG TPA: hypothetical protein VN837_13050 [Chloroflexota bacterium]|nr:hypothetical protein [Chloroflexota bacterium]
MRVTGLVPRLVLLLLCLAVLAPGVATTPTLAASAPARQALNITLVANPSTVTAGGATVLSGSGFINSEQIQIYFDSVLKGTVQVLPTGTFSGLLLTIPASTPSGPHTLEVLGLTSRLAAELTLTVLPNGAVSAPTLSLSPANVTAGGQVIVSGIGFLAGETIVVRLNGNLISTVLASPLGAFSGVVVAIPVGTPNGGYTVSAVGATSNTTATAALTVQTTVPTVSAGVSLSPAAALRGARILASGAGFVPGELVLITINSVVLASVTADAAGSFANAGLVVPTDLGIGPVSVAAFGSTSQRIADTVLTVLAAPVAAPAEIRVAPGSTIVGGQVTITGSGFKAHEIILLKVDGAVALSPTAGGDGSFSVSYTAKLGLGQHAVTATGASSQRAVTAYLVVGRPVMVGMHLAPNRTHRGDIVRVAGINFLPGEIVLVRFRGAVIQASAASSLGVLNATFTVPGTTPYGASVVSIQGARSGRASQALLGVLPAPSGGVGIRLSAGSVHHGGRVTVSGHGFQTGEIVLIRFRGALVQSAQADRRGAFVNAVFNVGVSIPFGTYMVEAVGANSGRAASSRVKLVPGGSSKITKGAGISVSATRIKPGQRVTVTGHGYLAGEFILIRLRGVIVQALPADRHGNFRTIVLVSSHEAKGATTIEASGARSNRQAQIRVVVV